MKRPLHTYFTFLFLIFFLFAQAQNKARLDSLFHDLKNATDTSKQKILCDIVWEYRNTDPDKAHKYADEAISLAEDINYMRGLVKANNAKGLIYYNTGDFEKALQNFDRSLSISKENNYKRGILGALMNIGNVYGDKGDNTKALKYYLECRPLIEESGDKDALASLFANIGSVYSVQKDFMDALVYFQKAEEILSKKDQKDPKLITIWSNIGSLYNGERKTDEAMKYLKRSLDLAKYLGNKKGIASTQVNIGTLYFETNKLDSAEFYFLQALRIFEQVDSKTNVSETCTSLAETVLQKGEYDKALAFLQEAEKMMDETGATSLSANIYKVYAKVYNAKKDFEKAFHAQERYMALNDSVNSNENEQQLNELHVKYESDKKEKEIEVLNATDAKNKTVIYAAIVGSVLLLILAILLFNRNRVKQRANKLLELQNKEIQEQKQIIEEKNKDITDSIRYAQRIQNAILPSDQMIKALFPNSFVLFKPKDIVSGDFYWFEKWGNEILFSAVDCTGHGVPGALMSVVGYNLLNQAVNEHGLTKPNLMLNELNKGISKMMRQNVEENVQDGMDIALCSYSPDRLVLQYSGAFNALYHVRKNNLTLLEADKIAIGSYRSGDLKSYTNHELQLQRGDTVYVFTDGYADQFGGPKGKKFKYKPFQELLLRIQDHTMDDQKRILARELETWKGKLDQVDDVLIIGIRV